jgi:hypothetical protein
MVETFDQVVLHALIIVESPVQWREKRFGLWRITGASRTASICTWGRADTTCRSRSSTHPTSCCRCANAAEPSPRGNGLRQETLAVWEAPRGRVARLTLRREAAPRSSLRTDNARMAVQHRAYSRQRCTEPSEQDAMLIRPPSRLFMAILKPSSSLPMMRVFRTLTASRARMRVGWLLQPILSSFSPKDTPGIVLSMARHVNLMPLGPSLTWFRTCTVWFLCWPSARRDVKAPVSTQKSLCDKATDNDTTDWNAELGNGFREHTECIYLLWQCVRLLPVTQGRVGDDHRRLERKLLVPSLLVPSTSRRRRLPKFSRT